MEQIAIAAGVIVLLILCASGGGSRSPEYRIEPTQDSRFYEVLDRDGNSQHVGTRESCEEWIREHGNE